MGETLLINRFGLGIARSHPSRTKAAFLEDVAKREFSFDLFEIEANDIRIIGDTAVVTGTYRNIVRVRGKQNPLKHARHLRVYVQSGGRWKLIAHQATEITPRHTKTRPATATAFQASRGSCVAVSRTVC